MVLNASTSIEAWLIAIHPKDHFMSGLSKAYGADKIIVDLRQHQKPNLTLNMRNVYAIFKTKVSAVHDLWSAFCI